jgi:putative FmdB family regulatory protein
MPTYDYLCEACGHAMEMFQSITESAKKKCPRCGKLKLKRLLGTGAGVIFKGSGFYGTDYRSDSYKTAAEKEKPSADAKTDKKETSSSADTKPETKPKTDSAVSKKKK